MRKILFVLVLGLILGSFALSCSESTNTTDGGNGGNGGNGGGGGGGTTPLTLSFEPATNIEVFSSFNVGSDPQALVIADIDGDGDLDVVAALSAENTNDILVYLGKGDGTFDPKKPFTGAGQSTTLVVADFDGSGKLDIASSNGTQVGVLLNNGTATLFGNPAITLHNGAGTRAMTAADVDGVNGIDLITSNTGSNDISILLNNNGTGAFPAAQTFNGGAILSGPRGIAPIDFNGGKIDLAVVNSVADGQGNQNLTILTNDENGAFNTGQNFPVTTAQSNNGIAVGNLNADSLPDVAVANTDGRKVFVLLNDGLGGFGGPTGLDSGLDCSAVVIADFNKDQKPDLAAANAVGQDAAQGDVAVFLGNGQGAFEPRKLFSAGTTPTSPNVPRSIAVGDLKEDGLPDLVLLNSNNGQPSSVSLLINTSN